MCFTYCSHTQEDRGVNAVTSRYTYPFPHTDHMLNTLAGGKWFGALNIVSKYWKWQVKTRRKQLFLRHTARTSSASLTRSFRRRCAANNLFIYSSCTWYSCLLSACWSWRSSSEECAQNLTFVWEGPRHPCGFASAGSSYYRRWVGLNGFDSRNDLVLGSVRIVTAISGYTLCTVTLSSYLALTT